MLNQPMSSPMMKMMLGFPPLLAVGFGAPLLPLEPAALELANQLRPTAQGAKRRSKERCGDRHQSRNAVGTLHFRFLWHFAFLLGLLVIVSPQVSASILSLDAPEADVTRRGVDRLRMSSGGPIAPAVVRRAQVRAAFQYFAWYAYPWLARIVALVLARPRGFCGTQQAFAASAGCFGTTSRWSTPRRCRSCRRARSRWAGMRLRARCAHTHQASGSRAGSCPARCWPFAGRPA